MATLTPTPAAPAAAAAIPVVDLDGDAADVARRLAAAAEEHGFIYVRSLDCAVTPAAVAAAFAISRRLFDAPHAEKQRCAMQKNNRGWAGAGAETLDPKHQAVGDDKEAFNFGEFVDGRAQQPVPAPIAADESRIAAFAESCRELSLRILRLLGVGLGVDDFFSSAHFTGPSGTTLRFLRYPPPDPASHPPQGVRAGAHSDYGSVTLLFRLPGQAGLEVLRRDNTWAPVPVSPPGTRSDPSPPILVNIGDLLSYWTNGLFRSTVHRVVFPQSGSESSVEGESSADPRYSIAFFCHPVDSTRLAPVPSERVRRHVADPGDAARANPYAETSVMTAAEHLHMRLKESFVSLYDKTHDVNDGATATAAATQN